MSDVDPDPSARCCGASLFTTDSNAAPALVNPLNRCARAPVIGPCGATFIS